MEQSKYEVIDLDADESRGEYETLAEARKFCYRNLRAYEIWKRTCTQLLMGGSVEASFRMLRCDPYEGDDDRIKQSLGMPSASEGN